MQKIPKVILLIETSRICGRGLLHGIAEYSRLHGPWVFYRTLLSYRQPRRKKDILSALKDWTADAIIIDDTFYPAKSEERDEIIAMGLPTIAVAIEAQIPGVANIITNGEIIGKMAAEHLLERGLTNFAYCGFDDIFWSQERSQSFSKTVAKAGFKTNFYKQPRSSLKRLWKNEQNVMADWLKALSKPVGLMACNDDRAQQVIDACKLANIKISDEIAIIGVDNDELVCGLTDPPLSSVALNFERAGYESAKLLDRLMTNKKVSNPSIMVLATHIATRQSTDMLAIEDKQVAQAVHFIIHNAKQSIQVSDVVDATVLSRRVLERRFRNLVGRSIHDEIRRVRVEQIILLLLETNLSVSKIAFALGYPGIDHIARYFRREKGISLQAYRKKYGNK